MPFSPWDLLGNASFGYRMGPPSDVCGFINHIKTPINYSYIYHKVTYKATERYRLGAPSCMCLLVLLATNHFFLSIGSSGSTGSWDVELMTGMLSLVNGMIFTYLYLMKQ